MVSKTKAHIIAVERNLILKYSKTQFTINKATPMQPIILLNWIFSFNESGFWGVSAGETSGKTITHIKWIMNKQTLSILINTYLIAAMLKNRNDNDIIWQCNSVFAWKPPANRRIKKNTTKKTILDNVMSNITPIIRVNINNHKSDKTTNHP